MMNNEHMKEAQEGRAVLEDVEDDTFVGFCEFAYTGDYRSRMMERKPEIENNIGAGYGTGVEWEEGVVPTPPEVSEPTIADEPAMPDGITAAPTEYWDFSGLNRTKMTKRRYQPRKPNISGPISKALNSRTNTFIIATSNSPLQTDASAQPHRQSSHFSTTQKSTYLPKNTLLITSASFLCVNCIPACRILI